MRVATAEELKAEALGEAPGRTTWAAADLGPILSSQEPEQGPTLLTRPDGVAMLYPGRVHAFQGEPESGKTWAALLAVQERLAAGDRCAFLDFEDHPRAVVGRLVAMGVGAEWIEAGLAYARPEEPLGPDAREDLADLLEPSPALVVLDGVTEAMEMLGLDPLSNRDAATFMRELPRLGAKAGAAVVLVDHVTKSREGRGRFALGAQHKLAGIDGAAYSFEAVRLFARGQEGVARIEVQKDRPGFVRGSALGGRRIGELHVVPDGDGVGVEILPPEGGLAGGLSPSRARVLATLAGDDDPRSVQEIGDRLAQDGQGPPLKVRTIRAALAELAAEGLADGENPGAPHPGRWWRA